MKKSNFSSRPWFIIIFCASLFLLAGRPAPSASAAFEDLTKFKDSAFDGIENTVIRTGLPDAKKKLWDKYHLLIKPFFKFRYDLTSNVFKAPDTGADQTDNLWTFTPGFQWLYQAQKGIVGGAYEASFRYFSQFSEQNEQDQKFLVYTDFFPTKDTYLRVSEKMDQEGATAGSSAFEPVDFLDNTVNGVTGYKRDVWTYELGYENFNRNFQSSIATRPAP